MPVPEVIGRYRVARRLGSGAFASVWLGQDDLLQAQVAIKVLAENWAHQPDIRARFVEEARILRRLDSEVVIRILDIGELPGDQPYFVMTYADRGTLADRIGAGPLPSALALRLATDIARRVGALNELGVIHRDLKPSNLLFSSTVNGGERLLIGDLGLAKAVAHASGFTLAGGTPGYMPPEQAVVGGGVDIRADVYAAGAIAYHLFTGHKPSLPPIQLPPSALNPTVPAGVDQVLMRALALDREHRWPDAYRLADALGAINDRLDSGPSASVPDPSSQPTVHIERPRRRKWRWLIALAAVVLAAAAGVAATALLTRTQQPQQITLADQSGNLRITVPAEWSGQVRNAGWQPTSVGLSDQGVQPGLAVSTDLAAWQDGKAPGVFVGLSTDLAAGKLPPKDSHPGCSADPAQTYQRGALAGQYVRHTCDAVAIIEVGLYDESGRRAVYVQLTQPASDDRTRQILDSLTVGDNPG